MSAARRLVGRGGVHPVGPAIPEPTVGPRGSSTGPKYKTNGTWRETLAEAKRAVNDPDVPAELRAQIADAIAKFEYDQAETVAFFRAGNAGPGTPEWDDYHARFKDHPLFGGDQITQPDPRTETTP